MEKGPLNTSMRMAFGMGVFLPLVETIRRIHQLMDIREFFSWFDDYILGAILLWAAIGVLKQQKNAISWLIAAWGIGAGALFLSFLAQFRYYGTATGDPGIFSTTLVAVAKGAILIFMLAGLRLAIRANEQYLTRLMAAKNPSE